MLDLLDKIRGDIEKMRNANILFARKFEKPEAPDNIKVLAAKMLVSGKADIADVSRHHIVFSNEKNVSEYDYYEGRNHLSNSWRISFSSPEYLSVIHFLDLSSAENERFHEILKELDALRLK